MKVIPDWFDDLTLQQQCVLLLATRGPDGIGKRHPCKDIQRAYRGSIYLAGRFGRVLRWGEHANSFISLELFADDAGWKQAVEDFLYEIDTLPHHFVTHLMHGAQILGQQHPEERFRERWGAFYLGCVEDMHLAPEPPDVMKQRLNDWGQAEWDGSG